MDKRTEVPACTEAEGVTILWLLLAVSADRALLLPVQQGKQVRSLRPLQPRDLEIVRQQRSRIGIVPEVKGQGFENDVEMAGEERFQERERGFLFPRE
jgi:hypothetical protein